VLTFQTRDLSHWTQILNPEKKHEVQFSINQLLKDEIEKYFLLYKRIKKISIKRMMIKIKI